MGSHTFYHPLVINWASASAIYAPIEPLTDFSSTWQEDRSKHAIIVIEDAFLLFPMESYLACLAPGIIGSFGVIVENNMY